MLDLTSFDFALKTNYTETTVNNLVYADHPVLALMPKDEKFTGSNKPISLVYGNPQGRSATFANAQANKGSTKGVKFVITRAHDYSLADIDNETIEASQGDAGALLDATSAEIDGAFGAAANSLSSALFRNGKGSIGQIASVSGGVVVLVNLNDITGFEVGMTIGAVQTDGGTSRSGLGVITAVDRDAGSFAYSGTITSIAAGDFIHVDGDKNAKIKGFDAWLPQTAPTSGDSHFGVDRSVDTTRLAGVRKSYSGAPIEECMIDLAARVGREGGRPNLAPLSFENYANLEKALGSKVQYVELKSDIGLGFTGIKIMGPKGQINVVADSDMHGDRFYMLTMKSWKLHSLGKAPKVLASDGMQFLRISNKDAVEVRTGYYAQAACNAPGWNGVGTL